MYQMWYEVDNSVEEYISIHVFLYHCSTFRYACFHVLSVSPAASSSLLSSDCSYKDTKLPLRPVTPRAVNLPSVAASFIRAEEQLPANIHPPQSRSCRRTGFLTSGSGVTSSSSSFLGSSTNAKWNNRVKLCLNKMFLHVNRSQLMLACQTSYAVSCNSVSIRQSSYLMHQTFIRLLGPFSHKSPNNNQCKSLLFFYVKLRQVSTAQLALRWAVLLLSVRNTVRVFVTQFHGVTGSYRT